jgi:hypothetical protein
MGKIQKVLHGRSELGNFAERVEIGSGTNMRRPPRMCHARSSDFLEGVRIKVFNKQNLCIN